MNYKPSIILYFYIIYCFIYFWYCRINDNI
nr:MAG TPA: hypothetical protein [Caudoviricetes sp.]